MATHTARFGVIGCGNMGQNHAGNVVDAGHEIAAGVDVVEAARDEFGDAFDVPTFESSEAMFEALDLDGVIVTTPNAFHEDAVTTAFEHDCSVLCEKPLADSLDAAERMVEAENQADGFGMVGFHSVFSTSAELFAAEREAGRFGEVTHVEGEFVRRRGIPGVGSWFTQRELSGGGAVIDIGVHLIDFVLYTLGFPEIVEVSASVRTEFGNQPDYSNPDNRGSWTDSSGDAFDVDDSASAFLRTADGTTANLEIAWATNREPNSGVVVRGTDAGAELPLAGSEIVVRSADTGGADHFVDTERRGNGVDAHAVQDRHFANGVASGEQPDRNTFEQGLEVQRVIDAIYRSSERGEAVSIDR
jgi:predicted dehydrogenase